MKFKVLCNNTLVVIIVISYVIFNQSSPKSYYNFSETVNLTHLAPGGLRYPSQCVRNAQPSVKNGSRDSNNTLWLVKWVIARVRCVHLKATNSINNVIHGVMQDLYNLSQLVNILVICYIKF